MIKWAQYWLNDGYERGYDSLLEVKNGSIQNVFKIIFNHVFVVISSVYGL